MKEKRETKKRNIEIERENRIKYFQFYEKKRVKHLPNVDMRTQKNKNLI